jgi:NAD(P)-dependent dehydrogenase (short-subunit alcohol dehydrogenase family)
MQKPGTKRQVRKKQVQRPPGNESTMKPVPESVRPTASAKLADKVALITGGDSGIGRAVAVAFAQQGCDVAIAYLSEHADARETARLVEAHGRKCVLIPGDLAERKHCQQAVRTTVKDLGRLDILVNNAGVHTPQKSLGDITERQLLHTFAVNVFACFYLAEEALKSMKRGSSIINTTSVTAYRGSAELIDYAATKGALVSFTRSLSASLNKKGIRVNAVAPGPVWTPLIPSSFDAKKVAQFGSDAPMERVGQPAEIAPCYVFLASEDASYITGQVLHPNGGEIVNG